MKKFKTQKEKGQMLIEIVVAIGIIGLVLIGVSDLLTRSVRVMTFQREKDAATAEIQKKLSEYKVARDSNPEDFYTNTVSTLLDPCETNSPFSCLITVDKTPTSVNITIRADWQDGGTAYNTSLSESLSRTVK